MKVDVVHIAKLANLQIEDADVEKFEHQLSEVLNYVRKLDDLDTKNVIPTSQVTGLENVLREDIAKESLPQELVILGSKGTRNGLFQVKGILENE